MSESAPARPCAPAAPPRPVTGTIAWGLAWLRRELTAERERWALWLPVAFGAGVALYFALPDEPPWWIGGGSALMAGLAACLGRRRAGVLLAAVALAALSAGFAAAQLRTASVAAPVLAKRLGPVTVRGAVHDLSAQPSGGRLVLSHLRVAGLAPESTPARVRVRVARWPARLGPGARVRLRAVLLPPPAPAAPGAFNFARRAYFQRIGAVGYAVSAVEPVAGAEVPEDVSGLAGLRVAWHTHWERWRQRVVARISAALPGPSGAVAAALMTGERGAIPADVMAAMRDSGLAHLLAISGLHMSLVAGLLFFAVRAALALVPRLALRHPIKKWAALAAACGGFGYLVLVGAPVPTQRAFLMVLLVLLAVLLDRTALSLRLVAWAAFAVLALAPETLLSASFQMSFAAVVALVAAYEHVAAKGWLRTGDGGLAGAVGTASGGARLGRLWLYPAGIALTSVIAILATAPFALYHFNRVAWYGLAANMVAVPLTGLWVMPWALAAFALLPLGLEQLALAPMGWGIEVVVAVAREVAAWPGAVSTIPALAPAGLALVVAGGLWLCLWRRPWRLFGVPVVLAGLASLALTRPPDVLVSDDAKLLAVRAEDGVLRISSARTDGYTAGVWARRAGRAGAESWSRGPAGGDGQLRCDLLGCIFRARGQVVALARDGRALLEDCGLADVVISLEPVRGGTCVGPAVVIDRFDIWRDGAHALWLFPEGVRVESTRQVSGRRPWVRDPWRARRSASQQPKAE